MHSPRQYRSRAQTKIVATVGPACERREQLAGLVDAGVDVFRLNMAHGQLGEHERVLETIRGLDDELRRPIAVLVDLGGPKIRLGELPGGQLDCRLDDQVRIVRGEASQEPGTLTVTYERLIDELEVNDRLMLADGTVGLIVEERNREMARCRVIQEGLVRSRQGVNLPGVKLSLPAMSAADREHAVWAATRGVDFVGLSFVRTPADVYGLKSLLSSYDSPARVIAKIEKQEALDQLEAIVEAADGVMVARGDLGVEIDVARMPVVQKEIVATCNRHQKPVIIATQMLDSMQRSPRPTRAEVTDVANAILDGCDACMLSGETAIGEYPRAAVEMMNRVALATEPLLRNRPPIEPPEVRPAELRAITHGVVYGAGHVASVLEARMIVVVSHSGATALALSKQRSAVPIIGASPRPATLRQMCLYWGVVPLADAPTTDSIQLVAHIQSWALRNGLLEPGDFVVVVAGIGLASRGHNMIRVHEVGPDASGNR